MASEKNTDGDLVQLDERIKLVYDWSSRLTAEDRKSDWLNSYVCPDSIRSLQRRLDLVNGAFIAVIGLQGVGKTSAFQAMELSTQANSVALRWPSAGNWMEALWSKSDDALLDLYNDILERRARARLEGDQSSRDKFDGIFGDGRSLACLCGDEDFWYLDLERFFSASENERARKAALTQFLRGLRIIFIDLPDYSKSDRRLMTRDLTELQMLWKLVLGDLSGKRDAPNLVVFIQKELFQGHFLMGKMDVVEIKPFVAEELVAAYKKKFNETYPFREDALLELARMSKGIFRRFLKYIRISLEDFLAKSEREHANAIPLNVEFVRAAVRTELVAADMELELAGIFVKAEARSMAVRILECVRGHAGITQKDLAQALDIDDATLARVLVKLEAHRYIRRERGEGATKRVSLANSQ